MWSFPMQFHKLTHIEYIIISHIGHSTEFEISYNHLKLFFFLYCPVWLRLVSVAKCIVRKESPKHWSNMCQPSVDAWLTNRNEMMPLASRSSVVLTTSHQMTTGFCAHQPAWWKRERHEVAQHMLSLFQTACSPETLSAGTIGFVLTGPTIWGGVW